MCQALCYSFTSLHDNHHKVVIIFPILKMRKWRFRGYKSFAYDSSRETKMAENDLTYTSESHLGIRCGKWIREGKSNGQGSIHRAMKRVGEEGRKIGTSGCAVLLGVGGGVHP